METIQEFKDKFFEDKPKNCEACNTSLVESGYFYEYKNGKIAKALCYKCSRDYVLDRYIETGVLTSNVVNDVNLDLYSFGLSPNYEKSAHSGFSDMIYKGSTNEVERFMKKMNVFYSYTKIYDKIKEFEEKVWFKGLQDIILKSTFKGVSAHFDNVSVLTYTMCGRTIITIEDKFSNVSAICLDDGKDKNMGFRGITAKEEDAIRLIDFAIKAYQDGKLDFKDDNEVSYI